MDDLLEQKWDLIKKLVQEHFGREPDIEAILFLIGIEELHNIQNAFTKEQKEDLMHVATCTVLSSKGYYEFEHYDEDGWPHFKKLKNAPAMNLEAQEEFLKMHIIQYFESKELLDLDSVSSNR